MPWVLAEFVQADVAKEDQVAALVAATAERFGRPDCAMNNAAITPDTAPVAEAYMTMFDKVMGSTCVR